MDLGALLNSHRELTLTPALLVIFYFLYRIDRRLYRLELTQRFGRITKGEIENVDLPV